MNTEPQDNDLDLIEEEVETSRSTPVDELDDLFAEARANVPERKLRKPQRSIDPSLREALDAASRKMRELYTNPDNWRRTQGLLLVDKESIDFLAARDFDWLILSD